MIAFTMGIIGSKAQTQGWKKHDVSVIYGIAPFTFHNIWDNSNSIGLFSAQYVFNPAKWLGMGTILGYQHFTAKKNGAYSGNDFTGMFMLRLNWLNKQSYMLYSKAAIGGTLQHENNSFSQNNNDIVAALHFSLIGALINLGKNFYGLTELGIGSQGLLMLGVSYKF